MDQSKNRVGMLNLSRQFAKSENKEWNVSSKHQKFANGQ